MQRLIVAILLSLMTMGVGHARALAHTGTTNTHLGVHHSPVGQHKRVSHPGSKIHTRSSSSRSKHSLHRKKYRGVPGNAPKSMGELVTVPTAAGINITVAAKLANQFQGFIKDIVDGGYKPHQIHCWAPVGTHVPNSNHYHGGACDFDQSGWNRTAGPMYHVGATAAKWGLRDGCVFRHPDCGHIDDGVNIGWVHPHNLIARYIDYANTPVQQETPTIRRRFVKSNTKPPLDNFEE